MSAKDSGVEDLAAVQQRDLGTGVCGLRLDTTTFRTAGLVQARRMLIESVPYVINLPISRLWDSYSPGTHLTEVKAHLVERGILSEEGDWVNVDREDFDSRGSGRREDKVFEFFSDLFNVVLEYLKQRGAVTAVQTMVNAGFVGPESTRISTNRPDAYVQVTSPTGGGLIWRKVVSPFEYKFGDGDRNDVGETELIARWFGSNPLQNDTKLFWSLYHTMRSDPRRNFALGVTILGTTFRVWLLCRAAPFTFTPFNWFEVGPVFVLWVPTCLTSPRGPTRSSRSSSSL